MNFDFVFSRMVHYISEHDANRPSSQSQMRWKVKLFQPCIDAFNRSPGKLMKIIFRSKMQGCRLTFERSIRWYSSCKSLWKCILERKQQSLAKSFPTSKSGKSTADLWQIVESLRRDTRTHRNTGKVIRSLWWSFKWNVMHRNSSFRSPLCGPYFYRKAISHIHKTPQNGWTVE